MSQFLSMLKQDIILELPSKLSSVAELEDFVQDIFRRYELCNDLQGKVLISLTEAVTNAIRHGNCYDQHKPVKVEVYKFVDQLKIVVSDEGCGFNPSKLPDPTAPNNRDIIGGRGVFLMRALCDKIKFTDEGRVVELWYNCDDILS